MILGTVTGELHGTIRHPFYDGKTLLVIDRHGADGTPSGNLLVAVDTVDAGPGDTVLVLDEGNGARQVLAHKTAPVRSVIVGIVDAVDPGTDT